MRWHGIQSDSLRNWIPFRSPGPRRNSGLIGPRVGFLIMGLRTSANAAPPEMTDLRFFGFNGPVWDQSRKRRLHTQVDYFRFGATTSAIAAPGCTSAAAIRRPSTAAYLTSSMAPRMST
jgi:hypothetical protein